MGTTLASLPRTIYNAREGAKFNTDTTLTAVECSACGILYAIPDSLRRSALKYHGDRDNGWKICCPLGHQWWYIGNTEAERLKEDLSMARNRAARLSAQLDQERAHTRAEKAAKTRFKNQRDRDRRRVAHGVCPCCGRTFKQLARHMASQHPEFVEVADREVADA